MEAREQRGLMIAARQRIKQRGGRWIVPSQNDGKTKYQVCADPDRCSCTCPDFEERGLPCKHIFAARYTIEREYSEDGSLTETETLTVTQVRKTYPQLWSCYNAAQTGEKDALQVLLHDLCRSIPEPTETRMGRPRLPLRDAIFSACMKVYSTLSSRRFTSDLRDAQDKGFIRRTPHFNSVLNVFDKPETTQILKSLIALSATPLAAVETNFAIDSSGFSGCRFDRWYDAKWGSAEPRVGRTWVKAHAMIGVTTNIVTAADVLDKSSGDSTQLPALMNETAQRFTISELSADKAYLSHKNLQLISDIGATPLIPFKTGCSATAPGVWNTAFHYFSLHREEFMERYHRRSNVESMFSAVKRKFGDSVRSKNDLAMQNEVLAKFVCWNLTCLIHAMGEFGIDPTFGCTKTLPAAQELPAKQH